MTPSDVKKIVESTDYKDSLEHMFAIQEAFANLCFANNGYKEETGNPLTCERVAKDAVDLKHKYSDLMVPWIWEMVRALEDEMRELKDLLPWKHWSKSEVGEKEHPDCSQEERLNHLRLELIDQIHFIMEALLFTGLKSSDVYRLDLEKNMVNIQRQENAYNDANKTQEDNDNIASSFKEEK